VGDNMDDNIGEIFYLDWHRDKLIGYERKSIG